MNRSQVKEMSRSDPDIITITITITSTIITVIIIAVTIISSISIIIDTPARRKVWVKQEIRIRRMIKKEKENT